MAYLAKYKKEDFERLSWKEYGVTLEKLYGKLSKYLEKNYTKIDAVVPILRGGAFPGAFLAFRLNLLRILSVQYKYFFVKDRIELRKIIDFSKRGLDLPKKATFLLVENNHCFGITAITAARDLKKKFPNCRIIYAADHMDYSYKGNKYAEVFFYGRLTNETKALKKEECKRKKIKNIMYLFPWESIDEELVTVKGKQFKYNDLRATLNYSKIKRRIKNI